MGRDVMATRLGCPLVPLLVMLLGGIASSCDRSRAYREPPDTLFSLAAVELKTGTTSDALNGALVSQKFFATAQVTPFLGRTFLDDEYQSGAAVVMLSHELWSRRFRSAPDIIGTNVILNGRPMTIVGILPPGFAFPTGAAVFLPVAKPVS